MRILWVWSGYNLQQLVQEWQSQHHKYLLIFIEFTNFEARIYVHLVPKKYNSQNTSLNCGLVMVKVQNLLDFPNSP